MIETRLVEGRTYVTNGSRHCPSPDVCDQRPGESYDAYVRRHCLDHKLGEFASIDDAERNLGVWCLFFLDKHIIGNVSLGTKTSAGDVQIVADYEPFWEDAEYLANWDFDPEDLEQFVPWEERRFRLAPLDERRPGIYKRFKKETKVRGTQKTSRAKAVVTMEHLHEYFVKGNIFFRVLAISAVSSLGREHYFAPLKLLWKTNATIKRLYGTWELLCRCTRGPVHTHERNGICPKCGVEQKVPRYRRVGLLTTGSFGKDTITMRWTVAAEDSSGQSIVSLRCAGVETALTGSRWDLVIFDDPHNRKNINTPEQIQKVKDTHAELRKQLDAAGRLLWLNTPWHMKDASQQIDDEFGDEFHILYRPAMWFVDGEPHYYLERDALGREVWTRERIQKERRQADFSSQVMLRPRAKDEALFNDEDFILVDPDRAPLEIRVGRGCDISEQDAELLRAEGLSIRGFVYVDPAGLEDRRKYGADTAIVGGRFDRYGNPWITHLNSGRFKADAENQAVFDAWVHVRADVIRVELSGAHSKHAKNDLLRFMADKAEELKRPIHMPFSWDPVSTTKSKDERVELLVPLYRAGRVRILTDAGPEYEIEKFKREHINFGVPGELRDYPDAFSQIVADMEIPTFEEVLAAKKPVEKPEFIPTEEGAHTGEFVVPVSVIEEKLRKYEGAQGVRPWGLAGGGAGASLYESIVPGSEGI